MVELSPTSPSLLLPQQKAVAPARPQLWTEPAETSVIAAPVIAVGALIASVVPVPSSPSRFLPQHSGTAPLGRMAQAWVTPAVRSEAPSTAVTVFGAT